MSQITLSEKEVRIQKTHKMKKMGIHPYAQSFQKKALISDIIAQYEGQTLRDSEEVVLNPQVQVQTAGRVMLYRSHGKLAFAKILDSSDQIQLMFHSKILKTITNSDGKSEDIAVDVLENADTESGELSAYKFMEKMVDL